MTTPATFAAYLAPEGFEAELREELGSAVVRQCGHLLVTRGEVSPAPAWAQNIWHEAQEIPISSVGDAAKKLKAIQRNWVLYSFQLHRRAALIAESLPPVSAKPLVFPSPLPKSPLGSWTLLEENLVLASPRCSSAFPNGEVHFIEDKKDPPSRAYLKLWEALTLLEKWPVHGEKCVDLGASPGGWTWVAARLGAHVLSIDRSPLDAQVSRLPGVEWRRGDAFALNPAEVGKVDWLLCDVACYPERLFELVQEWLKSGLVRNFVCTLKFQGATDHATAAKFQKIPGSRLLHLYHNKHELTWMRVG